MLNNYVKKKLKDTDNDYPRVLDNIQALLSIALQGNHKIINDILRKELEQETKPKE